MPRKQKPPGYEKWTWDEINQGRKMSKAEKRGSRLAQHLGATKDESGRIVPPKFEDNPGYWIVMITVLIVIVIVMIFFPKGCAH